MAEYISINGKESMYGIKLSGKADKVIEEIKKYTNEKGYFNFEIMKRKEVGKYGETHYVKVDDFKPKPKDNTGVTESTGVPIAERGNVAVKQVIDKLSDLPF